MYYSGVQKANKLKSDQSAAKGIEAERAEQTIGKLLDSLILLEPAGRRNSVQTFTLKLYFENFTHNLSI